MKNYIVTVTKALGKKSKVELQASSKAKLISDCSHLFGIDIAPLKLSDIVLKADLPLNEQAFYYEKSII